MDINMLILCTTATIVILDFLLGLVSSRYRECAGQYLGIAAYIILLANLSYTSYNAQPGMIEFQEFMVISHLVGSIFVIGYAINTYRTIRMAQNYSTNLLMYNALQDDYESQTNDYNRLEADARRLEASLQRYKEKERVEMDKHNARVISNEEFEETLPEVKAIDDTREAFQLYSLLISGYCMERGPKFEMHLHNVCERICSKLSEEDFRLLMQLDAELTREAGEYFNATNVFHRKNNKDV